AFKFSTAGTPVRVSSSTDPIYYALTIEDRGVGMEPDQVARIGAYTQFNRKTHEQQGSGLGLTLARRITELHGGKFNVQSQRGLGTIVSLRLPVAAVAP